MAPHNTARGFYVLLAFLFGLRSPAGQDVMAPHNTDHCGMITLQNFGPLGAGGVTLH
jgi:hypothetical protein